MLDSNKCPCMSAQISAPSWLKGAFIRIGVLIASFSSYLGVAFRAGAAIGQWAVIRSFMI